MNLLSFDGMLKYNSIASQLTDYSGRHLIDLGIISKTDSRKLNDALYQILHTMDKCGLVNQKGYNIDQLFSEQKAPYMEPVSNYVMSAFEKDYKASLALQIMLSKFREAQ